MTKTTTEELVAHLHSIGCSGYMGTDASGNPRLTFVHDGTNTVFAYVAGNDVSMDEIHILDAIATIDKDVPETKLVEFAPETIEVIKLEYLSQYLAQRAFSPEFFDLRLAQQCFAHDAAKFAKAERDYPVGSKKYLKASKKFEAAGVSFKALPAPSSFSPVVFI